MEARATARFMRVSPRKARLVVDLIRGTGYLFTVILLVLYTGELVWKERLARMDEIHDALPSPIWVPALGKLLAMMGLLVVLQLLVMTMGIIAQASKGYTNFELAVYFKELLVLDLDEADQVAEKQRDDANMEQVTAQAHVFLAQQLAGTGFPGVLITVVSEQAAQEELVTDEKESERAKAGPDIHCAYCGARNPAGTENRYDCLPE